MFFLPLLALVANCAAQNSTTAIASMCYNAMSCSQCTALLGCTYCLTSNRCLDNAVDVATLSTCASKVRGAAAARMTCASNARAARRPTTLACAAPTRRAALGRRVRLAWPVLGVRFARTIQRLASTTSCR